MRLIITSREVPRCGGAITGYSGESARERLLEVLVQRLQDGFLEKLAGGFIVVFGGFARDLLRRTVGFEEPNGRDMLQLGIWEGFKLGRAHQKPELEGEVLGLTYLDGSWPSNHLPFETACLSLGSAEGPFVSYAEPIFAGAFGNARQYETALAAGGGTTRIHIFNLDAAREALKRHGGGIIEEGLYLLHPKRDDVVVPFRNFHHEMLAEMTREARVVLGRMGAKKLIVETAEGMSFAGKLVSQVPRASGAAETDYERTAERRLTFEWGSPTFEPDRALEDCVWIRDNAGVMTLVDQRQTSNLVRFEEFSRIDTSFGVGLDVMKAFNADFDWAERSTYRYTVEFFDRPTT